MEKDNCPPHPALSTNYTCNFDRVLSDVIWNTTAGKINLGKEGAEFTIASRLESPTIQSQFYIFFGRLEVVMKAAPGQGVVSSIVLQSETLDEIDWEWVGSDTKRVQTNYYGKGNTTTYDRGGFHDVNAPMDQFHNYTYHWTKERLQWWLDGNLLRTLKYEDALGGKNYPQTPMTVRLGIWPAGDPKNDEGTREWAGGMIDYDAGPYTMVVKQMTVEDFSSGKQYVYGDRSGSWESIKIVEYVIFRFHLLLLS
jgi:beta-glucanase (GH16 family)